MVISFSFSASCFSRDCFSFIHHTASCACVLMAHVGLLVVVALLWGTTNPLMKKGGRGIEQTRAGNRLSQLFMEIKFLAFKWSYTIPFLINQCGSILYHYVLSTTELSLAVPVANWLTLLVTILTGHLLGERIKDTRTYIGIFLVVCGICMCVWDRSK